MTVPIFHLKYPMLSIQDNDESFPVHRIYCVGQNYAAHTIEMGGDPERDAPFFFSKPADAACQTMDLPWPSRTDNLHHEVELVVAIGEAGREMTIEQATDSIFAYAVGVDLTRRDLQKTAKQSGRPWDTAKGFDFSAPVGQLLAADKWQLQEHQQISLSVNGKLRQQASLGQLIWQVPELIKELSSYYSLLPGDLIFTGTPAGVAALSAGDRICATVDGLPALEFKIG